jgi:hypothetical protein
MSLGFHQIVVVATHRKPVVPIVSVDTWVHVTRVHVQIVRVVRRIRRTRPPVAVATLIVQTATIVTVARVQKL